MKILVVSNSFWNFYNFRMSLLYQIQNHIDCDIHLAAPNDNYLKKIKENFKFHNLEFISKNSDRIKSLICDHCEKQPYL